MTKTWYEQLQTAFFRKIFKVIHLAEILKTLRLLDFLCPTVFFSAKVAIVNTTSATIDFSLLLVSSSSLFLLLLSFSFVRVILEQIGLKKPAA